MTRYISLTLTVTALLLLTAITAFSQQDPKKEQPKPESQYVEFMGFKGEIFELKNRDPEELIPVLRALTSGFKGAVINGNSELKTITIRDFPENILALKDAIKRLDVPVPPRAIKPAMKDVDITVHILLASGNESDGNKYPQTLNDVIKQLQATLNYKSFQLLTTVVQRTNLRNGFINSNGTTALPEQDATAQYRLVLSNISLYSPGDDGSISIGELTFQIAGTNDEASRKFGVAEVRTRLNVRPGEKVVVGTASLKDRAVILVLTAKM